MNTKMIYYPTIKQLRLWGAEIMDSSFYESDLLKEWDSQEKANVIYKLKDKKMEIGRGIHSGSVDDFLNDTSQRKTRKNLKA